MTWRHLWSAPWGILGLVLALGAWAVGWGTPQFIFGTCTVWCSGRFPRWMRARHWTGFSFGWTVLMWADPLEYGADAFLTHELTHVEQVLRWGPLHPLAYLILLACYGYRAHPWEREARRAAGQEREA